MDFRSTREMAEAKKPTKTASPDAEGGGDWKSDATHFSKTVMQETYPKFFQMKKDMLDQIDAMLSKASDLFEATDDPKVKEVLVSLSRQRKEVESSLLKLLTLTSRLGEAAGDAAVKYGI